MKAWVSSPEEILAQIPGRFSAERARGLNVVVQFHLEGVEDGVHHVVVHDGTVSVSRGAHPKPTMAFTLESNDFVALATGDLSPQLAFMNRKIQIAGDVGLASQMLDLLGIVPR